jgi:hypothetical protein
MMIELRLVQIDVMLRGAASMAASSHRDPSTILGANQARARHPESNSRGQQIVADVNNDHDRALQIVAVNDGAQSLHRGLTTIDDGSLAGHRDPPIRENSLGSLITGRTDTTTKRVARFACHDHSLRTEVCHAGQIACLQIVPGTGRRCFAARGRAPVHQRRDRCTISSVRVCNLSGGRPRNPRDMSDVRSLYHPGRACRCSRRRQ